MALTQSNLEPFNMPPPASTTLQTQTGGPVHGGGKAELSVFHRWRSIGVPGQQQGVTMRTWPTNDINEALPC